jgi:hypothetical protein
VGADNLRKWREREQGGAVVLFGSALLAFVVFALTNFAGFAVLAP